MSERYIVVNNWSEFQHYKDRSPKWIKNYTELLHDEGYRALSGHQRGLLHGLWLEYASARAHLTLNTRSLTRRLGLRVMMRDLDALSHAGFITFSASTPLAPRYPRVREEKIRTLSKDVSSARGETAEREIPRSTSNTWVENLSSYTGCRYVRGEFALTAVYDVLGTEHPPKDWPYERPSRDEIRNALKEHAVA